MIGKEFQSQAGHRLTVHDIHSLLFHTGKEIPPVSLNSLNTLIAAQANLHTSSYSGSPEELSKVLKNKNNTLNGFVVFWGNVPVAYSIYYPMLNAERGRGMYIEDFFISQSFRRHGLGRLVFHELAKRATDDSATYMQWSTDKRNHPVHSYVKGVHGARATGIMDINASSIIHNKSDQTQDCPLEALRKGWVGANYVTRPIQANDGQFLQQLGMSRSLFRGTGDFSFRGFLTLDKAQRVPLAVTLGWWHLSTFKLEKGLCLEHPVIDPAVSDDKGILISVADCVRRLCEKGNNYKHVLWHVDSNDKRMLGLMIDEFGFQPESMMGTSDSEFVVYEINNGTLKSLAEKDPMPNRDLVSPISSPIGTPVIYLPNSAPSAGSTHRQPHAA